MRLNTDQQLGVHYDSDAAPESDDELSDDEKIDDDPFNISPEKPFVI